MKRKRTSEQASTRRMMNGWTLDVANELMSARGLSRREAFRQAWACRRLLEALAQGVVEFQYRKMNGEVRRARGTLCRGVSERFDSYVPKTERKAAVEDYPKLEFAYWDLDREAFRCFSAENILVNS